MSFNNNIPSLANQVPESVDFPLDPTELREQNIFLYRRLSSAMNTKEGALYVPEEISTFQRFFTPDDPQTFRNTYRILFDMVALNGGNIAAGATVAFPHGLTQIFTPTRIYGTATSTTPTYLPLPYSSSDTTKDIEIFLDNTNVTLINGSGQPPLTQAYVIFEFTHN